MSNPADAAIRADETAERIVEQEGFAFALAAYVGGDGDLREARDLLKAAIARAIREAWL